MWKMFGAVILVLCGFATARAEFLEKAFPGCSTSQRVCVINDNPGGSMAVFVVAASEILEQRIKVVVGSRCASACASVVDLLRKQGDVCLLPSAQFLFHKGSRMRADANGNY